MTIDVQPVIMAGGSGTRLWPLSRAGYPKQFLVLSGRESLFQQAVARLQGLGGDGIAVAPPCIVGNEEHRFLVSDVIQRLGLAGASVILEPVARNTAAAMALAALEAGADDILLFCPSDHHIPDSAAFAEMVRRKRQEAGLKPVQPETPPPARAPDDHSTRAADAKQRLFENETGAYWLELMMAAPLPKKGNDE